MDLPGEQRKIRHQSFWALLLCFCAFAASLALLPQVMTFPVAAGDRLVFAMQPTIVYFLWVFIAVRMVSSVRFRSPADIEGSAKGPPSPLLAVRAAFLQNTLEQAFVAVGANLVLASVAGGKWLALTIASALLFSIGRICFYRGYPGGAGARAFGMVTTAVPSLICYTVSLAMIAANVFDHG